MSRYTYRVEPDGQIWRCTEDPVLVDERFANEIAKTQFFTLPSVFYVDGNPVTIRMRTDAPKYISTHVLINDLTIKAGFLADGDNVAIAFNNKNSIQLTVKWVPPCKMRLITEFQLSGNGQVVQYYQTFLVLEKDNALYRLPLSNVYDDGHLCLGNDSIITTNIMEGVSTIIRKINDTKWDADLTPPMNACHALFKFKRNASAQLGFDQITSVDWLSKQNKIALDNINWAVGLP